ncbi:hypothetical protein [Streptomyces sp. NPDC058964]
MRRRLDHARRDPLTGLPGRDALAERTARLARTHHEQPSCTSWSPTPTA